MISASLQSYNYPTYMIYNSLGEEERGLLALWGRELADKICGTDGSVQRRPYDRVPSRAGEVYIFFASSQPFCTRNTIRCITLLTSASELLQGLDPKYAVLSDPSEDFKRSGYCIYIKAKICLRDYYRKNNKYTDYFYVGLPEKSPTISYTQRCDLFFAHHHDSFGDSQKEEIFFTMTAYSLWAILAGREVLAPLIEQDYRPQIERVNIPLNKIYP